MVFLCLSSLVEDCPQGLKDCMNPALGLEGLLKQRATELQGKEESQVTSTQPLTKYTVKTIKWVQILLSSNLLEYALAFSKAL